MGEVWDRSLSRLDDAYLLPDFPTFGQLASWGDQGESTPVSCATSRAIEGVIEKDEAISSSLKRLGMAYQTALQLQEALNGVFDFRNCQVGNRFRIHFNEENEIEWFILFRGKLAAYFVMREGPGLRGYKLSGEIDTWLTPMAGMIENSLSVSLWKQGESDALTAKMADIFAWDIDFYSDIQRGDRWRVLVEKNYFNGEFLSYGRVHALSFHGTTLGDLYAFYYETPDEKRKEYFDNQANALQKSFLRAPLNTTRVSSKFGFRMHPTLHKYKKHNGVDYGAPRGTPIWAIASGKVLQAGWMGPCGKGVKIRHANNYVSIYCHMSTIAARAGMHVRQKEMVGRVGNTGRSTGPHLHFGLMKDGMFINPTKVKYKPGKPLPEAFHESYEAIRLEQKRRLDLIDIPVFLGPDAAAESEGEGDGDDEAESPSLQPDGHMIFNGDSSEEN